MFGPLDSKQNFLEHVREVHGWTTASADEVFDLRVTHRVAHQQALDHAHPGGDPAYAHRPSTHESSPLRAVGGA